jgi:hypothetical protein
VGCQKASHEFAEVEGKVTLKGKPLHGVLVRFFPLTEQLEQPPYATGLSDASGTYVLKHEGDKPGAVIGPNRVVVYWPSHDLRGKAPPPPPELEIPLRYRVATESPLTVEVKPGSRQTIDLTLED